MTTLNPTRVVLPVEPRDLEGYSVDPDAIRVRVDGPMDVEAKIEKKASGELVAVFTTTRSGDYHVHLTHMGKHIKYSPMVVKVEPKKDSSSAGPPPAQLPNIHRSPYEINVTPKDEHEAREYTDLPIPSLPSAFRDIEFSVKAKTKDLQKLDARDCVGEVILGEDQKSEVKIRNSGVDDLIVSFQAYKPGKHKISVKKGGQDIVGSPFKIEVPAEAIYGGNSN